MNLTLLELNEIIYALGVADTTGMMVNKSALQSASEKIIQELKRKCDEFDREVDAAKATIKKAEAKVEPKVIAPITDTGSEVADFLIAAAAEIPEPVQEEVEEVVEKPKSIAPKKSKLIDPEN